MSIEYTSNHAMVSFGLLVARIVVGLLMAAHGAQKLFGWFGGRGLNPTGEFFVKLGYNQGRAFAGLASTTEIVSGLLVVLGFLGPVGPALMISVMIVAMTTVHWPNGIFAANNGVELPLLFATAGFAFAMGGFGEYSLDSLLGIASRFTPRVTWIVLAVAVAGAIGNLLIRRKPAA